MKFDAKKTQIILARGVEEVIEKSHLEKALQSGEKLTIKFGIDPTSPDLHLGHMVPLRKLRQFQDAGHNTALIIGDFTATIGDPSGRNEERAPLSQSEVKKNLKKYLALADKIIDVKKCKVFYNSAWFKKDGVAKILELSRVGTFQQVMRRADFKERIEAGNDITLLELLYPLFQGYDSAMVKADVEIGGTDQKFNLLMGRRVQRHFGVPEQDVLTLPLLEGTDGVRKMSKNYKNYIALDEMPEDMFAKIMSVSDALVKKYFLLLTDVVEKDFPVLSPLLQKKKLAFEIISALHTSKKALSAQDAFEKKVQNRNVVTDAPAVRAMNGEIWIDFLVRIGYAKSKSEAKRLVDGGGVDFESIRVKSGNEKITKKGIAKIGKHTFIKIKVTQH